MIDTAKFIEFLYQLDQFLNYAQILDMEWLNYHHLFYFRMIAKEGGIARAADKLRLGQPTLSTQLRQLENRIGKPLFERSNRRLILTEAGRAALDYSDEIFRLGEEMIEVLQDRISGNQIHLQVGALDSVPKGVILNLVKEAYKISPKCTVSILEGAGDELFRELYNHKIDLILTNYPSPAMSQKQVFSKSVAKLYVTVFGTSNYLKLKKGFPESLRDQEFVLPTGHSKLRHDINHFFKLKNIRIFCRAELQDSSLQIQFAKEGIGLAPLSEISRVDYLREGILHRIGVLKGVYEEIWLISSQRKVENPIAAQLIKSFTLY